MCTVLLPPGVNPTAVNKYINTNINRQSHRSRMSLPQHVRTISWAHTAPHSKGGDCFFFYDKAARAWGSHFTSGSVDVTNEWVYSSYLLANLLTPWSTVLPEKLTCSHLVKKFPAFYGTLRFITTFTSARHLSLSWAISIQSIPPHPTSWRSILILSSHLRLGLPSGAGPLCTRNINVHDRSTFCCN